MMSLERRAVQYWLGSFTMHSPAFTASDWPGRLRHHFTATFASTVAATHRQI
jgi:hypothetical protein